MVKAKKVVARLLIMAKTNQPFAWLDEPGRRYRIRRPNRTTRRKPGGDPDMGWLCACGHWEDSDFHCSHCGGEPPWGCDCGACNEARWEDEWEYDDSYY